MALANSIMVAVALFLAALFFVVNRSLVSAKNREMALHRSLQSFQSEVDESVEYKKTCHKFLWAAYDYDVQGVKDTLDVARQYIPDESLDRWEDEVERPCRQMMESWTYKLGCFFGHRI